jgi:long-chain acyl-CoA synthetase
MLLHEIIEVYARKTPEKTAISDDRGGRFSWVQFNDTAEQMASSMAAAGVGRGDTVALLAKNSCDFYAVYIAANKLGAAFAPINYRFAPAEATAVLRDTRPAMVILEEPDELIAQHLVAELPGLRWHRLDATLTALSDRQAFDNGTRPATPRALVDEDTISLICFTGGTSGRSKGVLLTHRNLLANAYNWTVHDEIKHDDVYLAAGALFHIGVAAPFAFWMAGARCVVMNFEPARALDLIEQEGITKAVASGTIFKMLVDEQERNPRRLSMRRIDAGAAPVPLALVERAGRILGCAVGQIYGQTECCFTLTYLYPDDYRAGMAVDATEQDRRRATSVGRAVPLSEVAVVDPVSPGFDFLGHGQVGEVVARGPNVMVGYLNMPDLTAQTVVDGWLRTGDMGELDEHGYLYLRGRKKDMIISGGENVYAQEVELVLINHPAIEEVVVIGIPDDHWGEVVCAIITPRDAAAFDPEDVRSFCRGLLARYKVPKLVVLRDSMPRLSSNKIDKVALRSEYVGADTQLH